MASSPNALIRSEEQASGENLNSWGTKLTAAIALAIESQHKLGSIAIGDAGHTLTTVNYLTDEARLPYIEFTDSSLTTVPTVTVPNVDHVYWFKNSTAYAITVTSGGTTGSVPAGTTCQVTNRSSTTTVEVWNPVALTAADVVLTNADVVTTNADVVLTNADVVLTGLDVASTNADVALTAADVASTNADVVTTNADVVLTAADAAATALDEIATSADAISTASDATDTGVDATATAADAISTAADAVSTASDATDTGVDAAATAADVILTASDVVAAAASEAAAAASAASINLPAIGGSTVGDMIVVNSGKTGYDFQSVPAGGSIDLVADGAISDGDLVALTAAGKAKTIVSSGSATSAGTPVVVQSNSNNYDGGVAGPDSNGKMLCVFEGTTDYGWAAVGTITGTVIAWGTPVSFSGSSTVSQNHVSYDSTADKFVIAWADKGSTDDGTACVCTVTGTTPSFGTAVKFDTGSIGECYCVYDSNANKTVISYELSGTSTQAIVGTVSGTSISFGTKVQISAGTQTIASKSVFDPTSNKIVFIFTEASDLRGAVGTVSGTSISFGDIFYINTGSFGSFGIARDSVQDKLLIAYADTLEEYNIMETAILTISGTSLTLSSHQATYNPHSTMKAISLSYDATAGRFGCAYQSVGPPGVGFVTIAILESDIILQDPVMIYSGTLGTGSYCTMAYDSGAGKLLCCYTDRDTLYKTGVVVATGTLNSTTSEFIGIAAAAISDTATGTITTLGGVNESQTGLTAGTKYYSDKDGALVTDALTDDWTTEVGYATATTKLLITGAL